MEIAHLVQQETNSKGNLLFISPQPQRVIGSLGYPPDDYVHWFEDALGITRGTLRPIDAINEDLPSLENVHGVFIGGSGFSVYENQPWQKRLEEWIKEVVQKGVPLFAVCYGHQALAKSLGGIVQKDPNGREFGISSITVDNTNPILSGLPNEVTLYTSHADSVTQLPTNTQSIGINPLHEVQIMYVNQNTIGIQAHPEFTNEIMNALVALRRRSNAISDEEAEHIINLLDEYGEGAEIFGRRILRNFLSGPIREYKEKVKD